MDNNSQSRQLWWQEPTPLAAWSAVGRVGGVCWYVRVYVHVRTVQIVSVVHAQHTAWSLKEDP